MSSLYTLFKHYSKYCECGCKELIRCFNKYYRFRRFKLGHHLRGNHNHFKGYTSNQGYIYDYRPNHPFCSQNKLVADHRLIYEHYLLIMTDEQIYLNPKIYAIHHINKNVKDNSLINLELLTHSEHCKLEMTKDKSNRFCYICDRKTRIKKDGYEDWYGNKTEGWKCYRCYMKGYHKLSKSSDGAESG